MYHHQHMEFCEHHDWHTYVTTTTTSAVVCKLTSQSYVATATLTSHVITPTADRVV